MFADYDVRLKKPICSRYGGSLFQRYFRSDGKTFNVSVIILSWLRCWIIAGFFFFQISVSRDKLRQIEHRLQQAIKLYKRRLEWLTTESRRVFGTIEEKSIAIILDIRNLSPQQFEQYKAAMERILKEQVTSLAKFNLIR
jgi:predicted PurR-regulated permease PerM